MLRSPPVGVRIAEGTAEAFIERLKSERSSDAFARGREAGMREAIAGAAGALGTAAERLDAARASAATELAASAVALAVEIARHILRAEISSGHHDIERVVRETLAVSGVGRGSCVVHVNPLDAEKLKHVPFRAGTVIEADHEVAAGDVHITTPHGVLVRDVDDALASIAERIRGELS